MSPPTTPAPTGEPHKPATGRRIVPTTPGAAREEPRAVHSLADCMAAANDDAGDADFVVIYGAPGTGKSSFAAGFPRPWFLRVDPKGTQSLPRSINKSNVPTTWDELPGKRFDPQRPSIMGLLRVILDSETPPGTPSTRRKPCCSSICASSAKSTRSRHTTAAMGTVSPSQPR